MDGMFYNEFGGLHQKQFKEIKEKRNHEIQKIKSCFKNKDTQIKLKATAA